MHNEGLLNINKLEIHRDSYFEMSTLYYFQLLILKDERNMGTKIPLMTKKDNFMHNNAGLLIISKLEIHRDSYFEMSTLYYFQLLILKDERNMGTKIPLMTKKDNFMHNAGLLIISKPEIHRDSYFEMSTLYYFQLLILKDKRNMGTKIPLMTKKDNFMHNNAGLLIISKLEIHRDSYFEMSTLYYFQLLILKDERNMGTKIPLMTKKDNFMHNAGLLIISKPEIHQDSYFEMSTLYYFQLPILKDERNMGTKIPLMTKKDNFMHNNAGLLIISKLEIHRDSYFEMSTLYYFQLLILKDERNMGTKIPLMTKKDNFMHNNAGLLIISKLEIHRDSYFEMSTLYYFQLLILKDERNMGTKIPLMTKKDNFLYNEGLLIIIKPKIHQDSYFEMSTLYYFQLLILKDERNMGTKIPLMTKKDNFMHNNAGLLIISKLEIHRDSYFEMSTLYYFQLLILKDERNMGTKIPLMTKKDNFLYNEGLLIIIKPKIHQDSYFEMSTLYYFQLLILKDERNMGTKIPLMTKKDNFMHNAGLLIISKPEIHQDSYFEMSTL